MSREELLDIIGDKVNEIFWEFQESTGIENGDIAPLESLELEKIQQDLCELVIRNSMRKLAEEGK